MLGQDRLCECERGIIKQRVMRNKADEVAIQPSKDSDLDAPDTGGCEGLRRCGSAGRGPRDNKKRWRTQNISPLTE